MWESKKLLKVTSQMCQGRDLQTWGMHCPCRPCTFFSCLLDTSMEFVVQKKASYKEGKCRRRQAIKKWLPGRYWEPPQDGSAPLAAQLSSAGSVWGLQVRSAITLLALDISHRDSEQPVGHTCVHTWAVSDGPRASTTCPILPSKIEEKKVLTLAIVLMTKEPGCNSAEADFYFLLVLILSIKLNSSF